jgi:hypothetical protein
LIRPLPFPQRDRLVMVWERDARSARRLVAPLNFHDWEDRNGTFDAMAALYNYNDTVLTLSNQFANWQRAQSILTARFIKFSVQIDY